ncbi:MAG: putative toxin-antitoxin system toxin component, PIN family [Pirellulales bacterium]
MSSEEKLVVVFDTNVIIPLSIPTGRSRSSRLFLRLKASGHVIAVSPQILAEVREKLLTKEPLRKWLKLSDEEIERFVQQLPSLLGRTLKGTLHLHGVVPADPKDDAIIAAAVEAGASYIISEDAHVLSVGAYEGIKIMNRAQFEAELDRLGVPD